MYVVSQIDRNSSHNNRVDPLRFQSLLAPFGSFASIAHGESVAKRIRASKHDTLNWQLLPIHSKHVFDYFMSN